ncbi:MAG: DUF6247 family protein [Actinomycetia bacterium]|nr:DUF6247 family protein [Actinomycetes bacterium]
MTAQPSGDEHDGDDPAEILHRLPEQYHAQFRAEYAVAVEQARRPEQYRMLHQLLRLWRLRAFAYSDPGYLERLSVAGDGAAAADVPAEQLIVGWPDR